MPQKEDNTSNSNRQRVPLAVKVTRQQRGFRPESKQLQAEKQPEPKEPESKGRGSIFKGVRQALRQRNPAIKHNLAGGTKPPSKKRALSTDPGKRGSKDKSGQSSQLDKPQIRQEPASEKEKRLLLWTGVGAVMAIILVFWVLNLKATFNSIEPEKDNGSLAGDWSQFKSDVGQQWQRLDAGLERLKRRKNAQQPESGALASTSSGVLPVNQAKATQTKQVSSSTVEQLKKILERSGTSGR